MGLKSFLISSKVFIIYDFLKLPNDPLDLLSEIFPRSKILIPFRDPLQQTLSLFSQHMKFGKEQNEDTFVRDYMKWIGHSDLG